MNEPYVMLKIDGLLKIIGLSPSAKASFFALLYYLEEDNTVDISEFKQEQLLKVLGLRKQTFYNGLGEMTKAGILDRISYGYYQVSTGVVEKPAVSQSFMDRLTNIESAVFENRR